MKEETPQKPQKSKISTLLTILVTAVVVCCLSSAVTGSGVYFWQRNKANQEKDEAVKEAKENEQEEKSDLREEVNSLKEEVAKLRQQLQDSTDDDSQETTTGNIEGSLSYPSEGIPSDMKVCAEDTSTGKEYCTANQIESNEYTYNKDYKLEVPAGSYYVYATVPSDSSGYKAYYNEFVECGLSVDCPSHDKIAVKVISGQTTDNIDPQDWYGQ